MKYLSILCLSAIMASSVHLSNTPKAADINFDAYCPLTCKSECKDSTEGNCVSDCVPKCDSTKKEIIKREHCESECKLMEKNWECI